MKISKRDSVFSTPWFEVIAKSVEADSSKEPYYCLEMADYVSVVALTEKAELLLVRQYRPAVEKYTLELPCGNVEGKETPEEAARRELVEETGYEARSMELLHCYWPDTGRLSNRMWSYFASGVSPHPSATGGEPGVELVLCRLDEVFQDMRDAKFNDAMNYAPIFMAAMKHNLFQIRSTKSK